MTALQMGITIAVCTAATMLTRFLPFLIFSSKDQQPRHPGGPRHRRDHRPPQMEAPDPCFHRRRHGLLCAAGAAGVRIKNTLSVSHSLALREKWHCKALTERVLIFNDKMYQN